MFEDQSLMTVFFAVTLLKQLVFFSVVKYLYNDYPKHRVHSDSQHILGHLQPDNFKSG